MLHAWLPRFALGQRLVGERAGLRGQLRRWRREASHGAAGGELSLYDNHPADVATELHLTEQRRGFIQHGQRRLAQVEAALARLEQGTYGACSRCGGPISAVRLWADPAAHRCIGCQRRQETAHPPGGRPGPTPLQEDGGPSAWEIVAGYGNASDPVEKR